MIHTFCSQHVIMIYYFIILIYYFVQRPSKSVWMCIGFELVHHFGVLDLLHCFTRRFPASSVAEKRGIFLNDVM